MTRTGVLFGAHDTFSPALLARLHALAPELGAEALTPADLPGTGSLPFAVIFDRLPGNHPGAREALIRAAAAGTRVINNPLRAGAGNLLESYNLARKLGIEVPPVEALPAGNVSAGEYDRIFRHIGFPALLRTGDEGGGGSVNRVTTAEEFQEALGNLSQPALLESALDFSQRFRCCVVGDRVHVMRYDPSQPEHLSYVAGNPAPEPHLGELLVAHSRKLASALNYDFCLVEFGVLDDIPYMVAIFDPAEETGFDAVGSQNFEWIVDATVNLIIAAAKGSGQPPPTN